jgi:hypothetical protein
MQAEPRPASVDPGDRSRRVLWFISLALLLWGVVRSMPSVTG